MDLIRKPTQEELQILKCLINKASVKVPPDWDTNLLVSSLNDEGMESLLLIPEGKKFKKNRLFGNQISEYQFTDKDGVEVVACLNLDSSGKLFEVDIWKTDFSPLIKFKLC